MGEGGTLNRQAGPRDCLHGARRRSRGRKIHCKARGAAAAACCCYERGVDIARGHEMEERDRWWWCWRREKNKKERIGVLAFSAVLQLYGGGSRERLHFGTVV